MAQTHCHIAHELPDMKGVDPGWKMPPGMQGEPLPAASVFDALERFARVHAPHGSHAGHLRDFAQAAC